MSEYHYLSKQFDDANLYFGSIEEYMHDNDEFHYNYGISLAASGKFKEVSSCEVEYTLEKSYLLVWALTTTSSLSSNSIT